MEDMSDSTKAQIREACQTILSALDGGDQPKDAEAKPAKSKAPKSSLDDFASSLTSDL